MGASKNQAQLRAVRGMNDILPAESWLWQHFETVAQEVMGLYGYQEIRFPLVEQTRLFSYAFV